MSLEPVKTVQKDQEGRRKRGEKTTEFTCPVCGCKDYVPSVVTLQANYGSINDGEIITVCMCGDCFDGFSKNIITGSTPYQKMG